MLLNEITAVQNKSLRKAITSICSAHPWVIRTALSHPAPTLIEATCNQVNQFGGYTGMTPGDFVHYVNNIALEFNKPEELIILGGDHLGPNVWKGEPAQSAMSKSEVLISEYVKAGFRKLHVDCSMPLGDDPAGALAPEVASRRSSELIRVAEDSIEQGAPKPWYVIGTEVPVPGGHKLQDREVEITSVENVSQTIELMKKNLTDLGLDEVWERVIAVVVQPGVEFGLDRVIPYDRCLTKELSSFIKDHNLVYEAHSTDYQDRTALMQLVEDHFAILKVGPALTFAFREAVFSLAKLEEELIPQDQRSNLIDIVESEMLNDPVYWQDYFLGNDIEVRLARKYSLSDRIRYYWNRPPVVKGLNTLLNNLENKPVLVTLLNQYGLFQKADPGSYRTILTPQAIIQEKIGKVLDDYYAACRPDNH